MSSLFSLVEGDRADDLLFIDRVTGLYNQQKFWRTINSSLEQSRQTGQPLSLIVIDLDGFKRLNSVFNFVLGNQFLAKVARLLKENCRATAQAFRYNGDAFCLLLPNTQAEEAYGIAERLRLACQELSTLTITNASVQQILDIQADTRMTMSLGIATFPSNAGLAHVLFEKADLAMLRAKSSGGNQACIYYDSQLDLSEYPARTGS